MLNNLSEEKMNNVENGVNLESSSFSSTPQSSQLSWEDIRDQRVNEALEREAQAKVHAANRAFDQYGQIVQADNAKQQQMFNDRNIACSAALDLTVKNRGITPQSLFPSLSQSFGMQIDGAFIDDKSGDYILGTAVRDANGKPIIGANGKPQFNEAMRIPVAMQLQIVQRANLGERMLPFQRGAYGFLKTQTKLTDDQLLAKGIRNPDGVTLRGGTAERLAGSILPQRRSSISAFGSDGKGGFTNYYSGDETGHQVISQDGGTRAGDGEWKVAQSGYIADEGRKGQVLYNSKTGERKFVPFGEQTSDAVKIAQLKNDSDMAYVKGLMKGAGRGGTKGSTNGSEKLGIGNKNVTDYLNAELNKVSAKYVDALGVEQEREQTEEDKKREKMLLGMKAMLESNDMRAMLSGALGIDVDGLIAQQANPVGADGTAQGAGASTLQSDSEASAKKELVRRAQGGAGTTGTNGANASAGDQNVIRPTMGPTKANAQMQKPKPVTQQERLDAALPFGYATTTKAAKANAQRQEAINSDEEGLFKSGQYTQAWDDIKNRDKPAALLHKGVRAIDRFGNKIGNFIKHGVEKIGEKEIEANESRYGDIMREAQRRADMTNNEIAAKETYTSPKRTDSDESLKKANARASRYHAGVKAEKDRTKQKAVEELKTNDARRLREFEQKLYASGDVDAIKRYEALKEREAALDEETEELFAEMGL